MKKRAVPHSGSLRWTSGWKGNHGAMNVACNMGVAHHIGRLPIWRVKETLKRTLRAKRTAPVASFLPILRPKKCRKFQTREFATGHMAYIVLDQW